MCRCRSFSSSRPVLDQGPRAPSSRFVSSPRLRPSRSPPSPVHRSACTAVHGDHLCGTRVRRHVHDAYWISPGLRDRSEAVLNMRCARVHTHVARLGPGIQPGAPEMWIASGVYDFHRGSGAEPRFPQYSMQTTALAVRRADGAATPARVERCSSHAGPVWVRGMNAVPGSTILVSERLCRFRRSATLARRWSQSIDAAA
jgi:hypothetical protein